MSVALAVWHIPALYGAAVENEGIHVLQHLCFLVASTIFWWPVIMPLPERSRMNALGTLAYLLLGSLSNSLLGIIETFGAAYISVPFKDAFAFLVLILFLALRPSHSLPGFPFAMRGFWRRPNP